EAAQKATLGIDRIDDLHSGMAHFLAVHNDDLILPRSQDLMLPAQQHPFQQIAIKLVQHGGKDRLFRTANLAGVWIGAEFQGAQLMWRFEFEGKEESKASLN